MRRGVAQFLMVVAREIGDEQAAAGAEDARGFGNRRSRIGEIVQHLVNDDGVGDAIRQWQRRDFALTQLDAAPVQLGAGEPEHFGAAVEADRVRAAEQFEHSPRAGAEIDNATERGGEKVMHRRFDGLVRCMKRSERVPFMRVTCKESLGSDGAFGADRGKMRDVFAAQFGTAGGADERGERFGDRRLTGREEYPAALAAAAREAGVTEDFDMAGDAWLALTQHLRQLADREFHLAEQRNDPQPRRIGQGSEKVGQRVHEIAYKEIFICGQTRWTIATKLNRRSCGQLETGSVTMTKYLLTAAAVATLALGACSKSTEQNASDTYNGAANDTAVTANEAVSDINAATNDAMMSAGNAMDSAANHTASAADKMRAATGNAMNDAGDEMKDTGNSMKR